MYVLLTDNQWKMTEYANVCKCVASVVMML